MALRAVEPHAEVQDRAPVGPSILREDPPAVDSVIRRVGRIGEECLERHAVAQLESDVAIADLLPKHLLARQLAAELEVVRAARQVLGEVGEARVQLIAMIRVVLIVGCRVESCGTHGVFDRDVARADLGLIVVGKDTPHAPEADVDQHRFADDLVVLRDKAVRIKWIVDRRLVRYRQKRRVPAMESFLEVGDHQVRKFCVGRRLVGDLAHSGPDAIVVDPERSIRVDRANLELIEPEPAK